MGPETTVYIYTYNSRMEPGFLYEPENWRVTELMKDQFDSDGFVVVRYVMDRYARDCELRSKVVLCGLTHEKYMIN